MCRLITLYIVSRMFCQLWSFVLWTWKPLMNIFFNQKLHYKASQLIKKTNYRTFCDFVGKSNCIYFTSGNLYHHCSTNYLQMCCTCMLVNIIIFQLLFYIVQHTFLLFESERLRFFSLNNIIL